MEFGLKFFYKLHLLTTKLSVYSLLLFRYFLVTEDWFNKTFLDFTEDNVSAVKGLLLNCDWVEVGGLSYK